MNALDQVVHAIPVAVHVALFDLLLQQFQLPDTGERRLVLVRHQRPVEVNGERQKHEQYGYEDDAAGPGGRVVDGGELDPAQDGDLGQEQEEAYEGGEGPGRLDVPVEAFVRRLLHQVDGVQAANGLDVGQDAGADHQGEHVDGDQEGGYDGKRHQHGAGDFVLIGDLQLHHGHHGEAR